MVNMQSMQAVSYTHLDVYKRQALLVSLFCHLSQAYTLTGDVILI